MPSVTDGPSSDLFKPLPFKGNVALSKLADSGISAEMSASLEHAPSGACVSWGIPFEIGDVAVLEREPLSIDLNPTVAQWLVFMHTSDRHQAASGEFISPMRGEGQLGEHAADYIILYQDGTQAKIPIRRRFQLGAFQRRWGENCFEAVAHSKPRPQRAAHEQLAKDWGNTLTRVNASDGGPWVNWLWAWQNPHRNGQPREVRTFM